MEIKERARPRYSRAHKFAGIRFVFLDRDGVLNRKLPEGRFVVDCQDLELLLGASDAVAKLNTQGLRVIVVTNQRNVALGMLSERELARLHDFLGKELAKRGAHLDAVYYCPHDPTRGPCRCRKPGPGLFEQAFRDFPGASTQASVMIGDSLSDIQAGYRLGMRTIFIKGEPAHRKPGTDEAAALADAVVESLQDAVERLMQDCG
jgi:D-glycero-D-manno-heptose 1,7-bisphosphate phosphatase